MDHIEDTLELIDRYVWDVRGKWMRAMEDNVIRQLLAATVPLVEGKDPPAERFPKPEYIEWPYKICDHPDCPDCKGKPDAPGWVTDGW